MFIPTIIIDERMVEVSYREIMLPDHMSIPQDHLYKSPHLHLGDANIELRNINSRWLGKVPEGTLPKDLTLSWL